MTTRIVMGPGSVRNIPGILAEFDIKNVFLVTDPGLERAGLIAPVTKILQSSGFAFTLFSEVEPNPTVAIINRASQIYREAKCQGVLIVGGGSSIDTGKGVCILATNPGKIENYDGIDIFKLQPTPFVVVPTTVGSGSEVTRAAALIDPNVKKKLVVRGNRLFAKAAVLDPELLKTLPPRVTAATSMDALAHAIEGYVSLFASPVTDALHRHAISMISNNIRPAVANSQNMEAMGNLLLASTITGMGFTNSSLGLVHAMSHPVSAHFNVPHGEANAILLPEVMKFNWIAQPDKFAEIALLLGGNRSLDRIELAKTAGDLVAALARDVAIPPRLSEVKAVFGPDAADVLGHAALQEAFAKANPRPASLTDIIDIYKKVI